MGQIKLFIGAALLALSSVIAYGELSSPALALESAEMRTGAAVDCAGPSRRDEFWDGVSACADCTVASDGNSMALSVQLTKYPRCVFRALTDACNYGDLTSVYWVPVLVVFVAILMEQSISGFRGGLRLALLLSFVALFAATFGLTAQLGGGDSLAYVVLVCLAASFGGALAHWIVYVRDLLPVVLLGLGLFGLFYLLGKHGGAQTVGPLLDVIVWAVGALGGVWLYFWRRRPIRPLAVRPPSDGTQINAKATTGTAGPSMQ